MGIVVSCINDDGIAFDYVRPRPLSGVRGGTFVAVEA